MDILGEDEYFDDEDLALESNNGPYYDENGFEINEYGDRIDEDGNVLDEEDLEGELYQEDGIPCLPDEQ